MIPKFLYFHFQLASGNIDFYMGLGVHQAYGFTSICMCLCICLCLCLCICVCMFTWVVVRPVKVFWIVFLLFWNTKHTGSVITGTDTDRTDSQKKKK